MPRTDNQKAVTGYLSLELYNQLKDFKIDEGLKSDSQAIAVILERFFNHCLNLPVATKPSIDSAIEERLKQLEKKIAFVEFHWKDQRDHMLELINDLLNRTEFLAPRTIESDGPGTVESTVEDVSSTVEGTVESDVLSTVEGTVESDVLSTVEGTVESDVPSTVEGTVESDVSSRVDDNQRFVVCAYHPSSPKEPLYWHGRKKGFKAQLETATSYAHESKVRREGKVIEDGLMGAFLQDGWKVSYKSLGELRQMQAERAAAIAGVN